jgi:hypothetical protein
MKPAGQQGFGNNLVQFVGLNFITGLDYDQITTLSVTD